MPKLRPKGGYRKPKPATEPSSQAQPQIPPKQEPQPTASPQRMDAYPRPPVIPDGAWDMLKLSLKENPRQSRRILRGFCVIHDIPMEAIAQRMEEEADALLDDNRVLH
jgi:hypothetical protein